MKKHLFYSLLFISVVLIAIGCKQSDHALPSLNESYRKTDKQPFGAFIAYTQFRDLFSNRYVETVTDPFDKEWENIKDYTDDKKYSLYFLITKNLVLDYTEVNAFMEYVKAGNDLFISADYVDTKFLENITCNNERMAEIIDETKGLMHQTKVSTYAKDLNEQAYSYYYYPFLNSLSGHDSLFTRVLGMNENDQPDYILIFWGKGRIYLHVAPRVFSNYFLLSDDNYKYMENVISYLRSDPKNIYWDEYYKNTNPNRRKNSEGKDEDNFSSLSVIKQHPPLLWAFWLGITGLLLYIIFNVKRKQRIIDVVKPNTNTTVNFTETVGRLYLQQKDNNHIAEKMITYFYEHIRNKYFISTSKIDNEFINSLSGKSGVSHEKTQQLFSLIESIQSGGNVDDKKLMQLNTEIENFYKNQS